MQIEGRLKKRVEENRLTNRGASGNSEFRPKIATEIETKAVGNRRRTRQLSDCSLKRGHDGNKISESQKIPWGKRRKDSKAKLGVNLNELKGRLHIHNAVAHEQGGAKARRNVCHHSATFIRDVDTSHGRRVQPQVLQPRCLRCFSLEPFLLGDSGELLEV